MIEDLIETGQYKEALQYLNDMDNEQVRYQRLVCLYGMQELQQAKKEGLKAKALAEAEGMENYDYLIINDTLEECVEQMHSVIQAEHLRCSRNTNFIEKIQKELKEMKGE